MPVKGFKEKSVHNYARDGHIVINSDGIFYTVHNHLTAETVHVMEYPADPRSCILEGRTRVGGGLSNPAYLALTKGVKVWRKVTSGSV